MGLSYDQQEPIWDARTGLVHHGEVPFGECVRRLHRALPTIGHAGRLIEVLLDRLGERGRVDPYTDGTFAKVLRADPQGWWLRRSPATLYDGAQWAEIDHHSEVPAARPADPAPPSDPPPDIVPSGLGRGVITLRSGDAVLELRYGEDGLALPDKVLCRFGDRWAERRFAWRLPPTVDPAARPPQPPVPPWLADLPDGLTVEALAERMLASGPELDPVRVRMHVDAPGGVEGCWWRAYQALRKLAMDDALPASGGVYVLDAFEHEPALTCLAVGATLAEAEAAWLAKEREQRPKPVHRKPEPLPEVPEDEQEPSDREIEGEDGKMTRVISTGTARIVIQPVRVIPWPIPGPRTTPAVAVRVPPMPSDVPEAWADEGFTRWRYAIGDSGRIGFFLIRDEPGGWTQVGDGLLDVLDPRDLSRRMDEAIEAELPFPYDEPPWLKYPYEHRYFTAFDNLFQRPRELRTAGAGFHSQWSSGDGDHLRWQIARMRYRG